MKRFISAAALVTFLLLMTIPAFSEESDMFVKTIPIIRVASHKLGFKVNYPISNMRIGELYLPGSWFEKSGSKGEVIWGNHPSYPCMSIFWKDGEFHHIRLYLENDFNKPSWGVLDDSKNYSELFNVDTVELDF